MINYDGTPIQQIEPETFELRYVQDWAAYLFTIELPFKTMWGEYEEATIRLDENGIVCW